MRFLERHPVAFVLALALITVMSVCGITGCSKRVPPAATTEQVLSIQFESAPVAVFGLYNCRGWAGALLIESSGASHILSMKPSEALQLAKKYNIATEHQNHLFPAQGDCGGGDDKGPPYVQENPNGAPEDGPADSPIHPEKPGTVTL